MKNSNKLQIILRGKKFARNYLLITSEVEDNNLTELELLIFELHYRFDSIEGTIDISAFNDEISVKIDVKDIDTVKKIKHVIEHYLGFILYIQ